MPMHRYFRSRCPNLNLGSLALAPHVEDGFSLLLAGSPKFVGMGVTKRSCSQAHQSC